MFTQDFNKEGDAAPVTYIPDHDLGGYALMRGTVRIGTVRMLNEDGQKIEDMLMPNLVAALNGKTSPDAFIRRDDAKGFLLFQRLPGLALALRKYMPCSEGASS